MKPGDVVQCVIARGSCGLLNEGQHYVIDRMGPPGFVYVVGVEPWRPGFYVQRFRRLPQTSIGIFTAMLQPKETVNGQKDPCKVEG